MFKSAKKITVLLCGLVATTPLFAFDAPQAQARIVGGSDMTIDNAPSTVALLSNQRLAETGSYYQSQNCGGTVIDAYWVLTAAHCLKTPTGATIRPQDISVLMGTTDLNAPINQPVGVTNIILHSGYNAATHANDIALLRLEYAALVPATPLDTNGVVDNDVALIAGWGALNPAGNGPQYFESHLKGALVYMIAGDECERVYSAYSGQVDERNICAGLGNGGVDACQGDSGGPLYRVDQNNPSNLRLSGVVSWGHGCGDANAPGIYAKVSAYTNWIAQQSGVTANQSSYNDVPVQNTTDITNQTDIGTDPVPTNFTQDSRARSGGGSNGFFILSLLAMIAAVRNRGTKLNNANIDDSQESTAPSTANEAVESQSLEQRVMQLDWLRNSNTKQAVAVAAIAAAVSGCSAHSATPDSFDIQRFPIGDYYDEVIAAANTLWRQAPSCTLIKTAYGNDRRAYFLETCTFSAQRDNTFCGARPTWAEYRFLESQLIQVSLEFDLIDDKDSYDDCVDTLVQRSTGLHHQTKAVEGRFITTVSDAKALSKTQTVQ